MTISPDLLRDLDCATGKSERRLSPESTSKVERISVDKKLFRWMMNDDAMATEKLAEGIRSFAKDLSSPRSLVTKRMGEAGTVSPREEAATTISGA